MDWDDTTFDTDEFELHFKRLNILENHTVDELKKRTTKNTRSGREFGFKPTHLAIGSVVSSRFHVGFESTVDRDGRHPHNVDESLPSSFWIRFADSEKWFQIRAMCSDYDAPSVRPYECRIPFRDCVPGGIKLRALYRKAEDRVTVSLTIQSRRPPRYAQYLNPVLKIGREAIYDRHATEADFFQPPELERFAGAIDAIQDCRAKINPGIWLVHRLTFDITARQYKLMWMCMVKLRMLDLYPDFEDASSPELQAIVMCSWLSLNHTLAYSCFEIRYLVEALLSHGTIALPEVTDLLRALERVVGSEKRKEVLGGLFMWTRRGSITTDITDVARRVAPSRNPATHLVPIRRCLVTPTKCILNPPAYETSNSLLRRFSQYLDRFLRVQFVDDDGDFPVSGETLVIDDNLQGEQGVFARVGRALSSGINIAGRTYVFLCFSESQARECACWMISETDRFTVDAVLQSMGDLSEERVVAKHAARQSLALSTTRTVNLQELKITRGYPDIVRNGYTFTDGTGHCTQTVADQAGLIWGHRGAPVSAFQGRDGGVKGVWVVVRDPTLATYEIRERDSQVKFSSQVTELSVLKVATYARATLNRQAIILLEAQGVRTEALMDIFMQEKVAIEGLEHGFDRARLAAVSMVNRPPFPFGQAFTHQVTEDPFVNSIKSLVECRLLSDLKWKAWIEIEKSAFAMGVPDETNSLNEDEVFCQVQPAHDVASVITGPCVIYRNPCLHPGDVRLVTAVDCPSLHHLYNVIVFNTRGERDLPNMLSGGDLDGDLFSLIWDPRLLITNVHYPMDYTPPVPLRSPHPVTISQTKEHFLDFMKNDVLGRICNSHMALADRFSPADEQCLQLAQLASQAVDFCKTGVKVSQDKIPKIERYPDFMGKDFKSIRVFKKQAIDVYKSNKALGQMFRKIDPEPVFVGHNDIGWATCGDPRLLWCDNPQGYKDYLRDAAVHKVRYEFELEGLLRRYNISEEECVAGLLLRSPKARVKVERDYDLRIAVREAYARATATAVERIKAYLDEHPSGQGAPADRRAWALASYKLTYNHDQFASYFRIDWTSIDADVFAEKEEDEELEAEFQEIAASDATQSTGRRFSFAWLLPDEIFDLLATGADAMKGHNSNPELIVPSS